MSEVQGDKAYPGSGAGYIPGARDRMSEVEVTKILTLRMLIAVVIGSTIGIFVAISNFESRLDSIDKAQTAETSKADTAIAGVTQRLDAQHTELDLIHKEVTDARLLPLRSANSRQ